MLDSSSCACDANLFAVLDPDDDTSCICMDDYILNSHGNECAKCYGVLFSLNGADECSCAAPAIFDPHEVAHCICNDDENYVKTDDGLDCIVCYGNGAGVNGTSCACDADQHSQDDPDEAGHCMCIDGFYDNGNGECTIPELNVFTTCILNFVEENQDRVENKFW